MATYYVSSSSGNDSNNGISTSTPWKSINKVNYAALQPGDTVCFECGDTWRGLLRPQSGSPDNPIIYTKYGSGALPIFLGSQQTDSGWTNVGTNLWYYDVSQFQNNVPDISDELCLNPSFDTVLDYWGTYHVAPSSGTITRDTDVYHSAPASLRYDCINNASEHGYQINVSTIDVPITSGGCYRVKFWAKATAPFTASLWAGMANPPSTTESTDIYPTSIEITTDWIQYEFVFVATMDDSVAAVEIYIGNPNFEPIGIPTGASFWVDDMTIKQIDTIVRLADIGNVWLDGESGWKKFYLSDLTAQGYFYCDPTTRSITMYSTSNPATLYDEIEFAIGLDIIDDFTSYHIIEDIEVKYGGTHGYQGNSVSYVTVQYCDFNHIGGSLLNWEGSIPVRYGNGVELRADAGTTCHDILIQHNKFSQIYDTGVTNQGSGSNVEHYNINYLNNIIDTCEMSFEVWFHNVTSKMYDINFKYNTCTNAGYGWSHVQRPDQKGCHLTFFSTSGLIRRIRITNNTFDTALGFLIYVQQGYNTNSFFIDYNAYTQPDDGLLYYRRNEVGYLTNDYMSYIQNVWQDISSTFNGKSSGISRSKLLPEFNTPMDVAFYQNKR